VTAGLAIVSVVKSEWFSAHEPRLGSLALAAILVVGASLIAIGLWRRSRIAFFFATLVAVVSVLPLPAPALHQLPIYTIQALLMALVLILLLGERSWFFQPRTSANPTADG
jgi:hypothetical protein